MRILVHICCGPCAITVLQGLLEDGHEPVGLFFNPNIQPLAEYMRRRQGAVDVAARLGVPLLQGDLLPPAEQIWRDPWRGESGAPFAPDNTPTLPEAADPAPWLRAVAGRERERCAFCTRLRLAKCAELAKAKGFAAFTTSLLFSRHQRHEQIKAQGETLAGISDVPFFYRDYRPTWQEGVRLSKEWGVYRQQYCGCMFSEYERYARDFEKLRLNLSKDL